MEVAEVLTVIGVGRHGPSDRSPAGLGQDGAVGRLQRRDVGVCGRIAFRGRPSRRVAGTVDVSSPESVRELAEFSASLGDAACRTHRRPLSIPGPGRVDPGRRRCSEPPSAKGIRRGRCAGRCGCGDRQRGRAVPSAASRARKCRRLRSRRLLLELDFIGPASPIRTSAYPIAKPANHIRVRAASAHWGRRGARIISVSPGSIYTDGAGPRNSPPPWRWLADAACPAAGHARGHGPSHCLFAWTRRSLHHRHRPLVDGGVIAAMRRRGGGPTVICRVKRGNRGRGSSATASQMSARVAHGLERRREFFVLFGEDVHFREPALDPDIVQDPRACQDEPRPTGWSRRARTLREGNARCARCTRRPGGGRA